MPVEALVFLDECGFGSNLRREYGRSIGGARCVEEVPKERGENRSVVGALSLPSVANPTGLWSLWQRDGAWTGQGFTLFIEEALLPHLPPASVLVLDNARIHHGVALREAVEAAGHRLLFLPPYSPDFNPIELVWSWLKNWVRALAPTDDQHRNHLIWSASERLPPQHATAWFRNCGFTTLLSD